MQTTAAYCAGAVCSKINALTQEQERCAQTLTALPDIFRTRCNLFGIFCKSVYTRRCGCLQRQLCSLFGYGRYGSSLQQNQCPNVGIGTLCTNTNSVARGIWVIDATYLALFLTQYIFQQILRLSTSVYLHILQNAERKGENNHVA